MTTEDLPGFKIATDYGYDLHSHTGDRKSADYMKGPLLLRVWHKDDGLEASLMAVHGIVKLEVGPFAFPHKHLTAFAVRILDILPAGDPNP